MWKLNIDKSFEEEYIHRMLPSLVTRVKTWKGRTSLYRSFRSELLPDWNRDPVLKYSERILPSGDNFLTLKGFLRSPLRSQS